MTRRSTVDVAVVGLGFGEDFLPVYRAHPGVGEIAVVDASPERLDAVAGRHSITHRYTDFHEMLQDDRWQAVHVLAPVRFHADYSVAALEAGRHVACAVPMATELADVDRVVAAQRESGTTYTMMETAVYGREFRFVQQLADDGRLGALTMYRGFHLQNLDGYPEYWRGYPPMKYATHALAPLLALTGSQVATVTALGSGTLTPERIGAYDNPFPAQTGVFRLTDSDVSAVLQLSFFQTARSYVEGFDTYGDRGGVEWPLQDGDPLRVYDLQPLADDLPDTGLRGRRSTVELVHPSDRPGDLPAELVPYLQEVLMPPLPDGTPEVRRAEHGGAHPYLVDAFVRAAVGGPAAVGRRPPVRRLDGPGHLRPRLVPGRGRPGPGPAVLSSAGRTTHVHPRRRAAPAARRGRGRSARPRRGRRDRHLREVRRAGRGRPGPHLQLRPLPDGRARLQRRAARASATPTRSSSRWASARCCRWSSDTPGDRRRQRHRPDAGDGTVPGDPDPGRLLWRHQLPEPRDHRRPLAARASRPPGSGTTARSR